MIHVAWMRLSGRLFALIGIDWQSGEHWLDEHFVVFEAETNESEYFFFRDSLDAEILEELQSMWEQFHRASCAKNRPIRVCDL